MNQTQPFHQFIAQTDISITQLLTSWQAAEAVIEQLTAWELSADLLAQNPFASLDEIADAPPAQKASRSQNTPSRRISEQRQQQKTGRKGLDSADSRNSQTRSADLQPSNQSRSASRSPQNLAENAPPPVFSLGDRRSGIVEKQGDGKNPHPPTPSPKGERGRRRLLPLPQGEGWGEGSLSSNTSNTTTPQIPNHTPRPETVSPTATTRSADTTNPPIGWELVAQLSDRILTHSESQPSARSTPTTATRRNGTRPFIGAATNRPAQGGRDLGTGNRPNFIPASLTIDPVPVEIEQQRLIGWHGAANDLTIDPVPVEIERPDQPNTSIDMETVTDWVTELLREQARRAGVNIDV